MKNLTAILLDEADVKDASAVMTSLSDEANDAAIAAPIVIFRGQIVKNRFDGLDRAAAPGMIQPDYRAAIALALSAFAAPATTANSMARASAFVCYLAGIVRGQGDERLADSIFAVVQPREFSPATAEVPA